ncbi:hypothetical protein [Adlercreutzia sp. ZJ154]|uniref:hypothetical protein n=1 Tax=Adlercreutzia sp. ZJ154 TaxID=2709790 RepID=UPI0013ECAF9B|nr:hypothetical protein [Adlercreutzia sp. ZJ154]
MKAFFSILDYADYNTRVISDIIDHPSVAYHRRYTEGDDFIDRLRCKLWSYPEQHFGSWYAKYELDTLFGDIHCKTGVCPILIVYECNSLSKNIFLLKGMKKKCSRLKLVLVLTNIIGSTDDPPCLDWQKKVFDLIVTFNENDADYYDLAHYEGMYSHIDGVESCGEDDNYLYDLYFCGKDKGRIPVLISIAELLKPHTVTYRFDIIGDTGPNLEGFFYYDHLIPNSEMLHRSSKAKTILEIVVDPSNKGSSLRPYEAYALGVKLLSNNKFLPEKPWFNSKQIALISEAGSLDIDFICTPLKFEDAQDVSVLSPVNFLRFISDQFGVEFNAGN